MDSFSWAALVLLLVDWLIRLGLSFRVIMRRRAVGSSLAWLSIILLLPFAGGFLYVLIGEAHLGRTRARRAERFVARFLALRLVEPVANLNALGVQREGQSLARLAKRLVGFNAQGGNRWELLTSAPEFFARLIQDLDAAQESICLQFYIWHLGGLADEVVDAVVRAAQRGVRCHVMVDALGSAPFVRGPVFRRLKEAGVAIHASLPVGFVRLWFRRLDLRNHRKIVVIDERIGYTGSQNLVDPRFFKQDAHVGEWVDAMVRLEGPVVDALWLTFVSDWELDTGQTIDRRQPQADGRVGPAVMQAIPSGPQFRPEVINQILLTAVYSAQRELVITSPYFVPDERLLTALSSAALRGVDVTVVIPAKNDSRLVRLACEAMMGDLLINGVKIQGFNGGLLHTKSITVDGQVSLFGSLNLDPRSLWLNFEISLLIYDEEFATALRALQKRYIHQSTAFELAAWQDCSTSRRVIRNAVRLLAPLL